MVWDRFENHQKLQIMNYKKLNHTLSLHFMDEFFNDPRENRTMDIIIQELQ